MPTGLIPWRILQFHPVNAPTATIATLGSINQAAYPLLNNPAAAAGAADDVCFLYCFCT